MKLLKSALLGTAAGFAAVAAAQAADLPVKAAAPIEYVRVCGTYGAGFFYIPGTDTCMRLSGRARFEYGYANSYHRGNSGNTNQGDYSAYIGLLRFNLDARTQTGYGTLRAFLRLEGASRSGASQGIRSGTQERFGRAYGATGQDQSGRLQQFMNVDKAFIQFAGLTAGRASSFFDFYAHDFELQSVTAGSDNPSTNLIAYTYTAGNGLSFTGSMEDPSFRRNGIYSQEGNAQQIASRVFQGFNAAGLPIYGTVDVTERNRMPDFVGVGRLDQPWGSLQVSAASHELNTGDFNALTATNPAVLTAVNSPAPGTPGVFRRPSSEIGFAVQAGAKFNLPFIAPGDGLYLQAAYADGATLYSGSSQYSGSAITQVATINGAAFNQWVADASLNPLTGKIQKVESYSVVGSYLHYWTPELRSAFFGSYSAINFGQGAREANFLAYNSATSVITSSTFIGSIGSAAQGGLLSRSFQLSPVMRDSYQYTAGASLIWSPVKDLDIGAEGTYIRINMKSGRVVDQTQNIAVTAAQVNAGAFVKTVSGQDTFQARFRVQRDF